MSLFGENIVKKILIALFLLIITSVQVKASNFENIKYKNISDKSKISYNKESNNWSFGTKQKAETYIKTKGFGNYYDYIDSHKDFAFTTNCEYEFITNGKFIGYSNSDFLFYRFDYANGFITKTKLEPEEIQALFPDYRIIKLSEFSSQTNALKIKKGFGDLKIIIYNDKDVDMRKFLFTTGNSEIEEYPLAGFLNIKKKGMIQLTREGDSMKNSPWFILLVR